MYEDFDRQVLKDGSGFERQYSKELEPQQILNGAYDFVSALEKGLQEENLPSLIDLLPHKKNGTLCIGRKNVLLTCSFCDHQGMSYSFFAKSVSDTEVELTVKKVYIGDTEYTKDDLVNTFRAILPTDHPIVQPVKTVKTTKENKSPEKKTAGKNTAAKETTVKPVEPEAEKQDTESAEDRDEDDDRSCAVQAADTCYIYIWVETKNGNTYECKYSDQNDRVHGDRNFPGTQKSVLKKLNSMGDFVGLARRWFAEGAYFLEGKEDSEIDEDYGQGDLEKISALKPEDVNHITVEWGVDSSEIQFDKEKEYDADELALFGTATAKAPQKKPQKKIYFSDVHPEKRREAIMKEYSDVIITDVAELDFKGKHVWDRGINEDYEDENVTDIDAHNYILFHGGKISMNMDEKTDYMMISHDGQSNYQKMNELNKKGAAIRAFFAEDLIDIIKREYVEETEKGHLLVKHLAYCVTHRRLSDESFCGYENVTHIELDDQITKITYNAFSYLSQLKYVKLPASLRTIDDNAFMDCKSLETIELPETLRKIGEDAFDNCISLKSISLPESLKQIERGAFSCCKSFETIRLPKAVKQIKESMFSGCEKLKEIVWPDQLERIGDKAFGACLGLNEISIPKSCRTIGECAFIYCFNLKTVRISGPIKKIPLQAFFHCNQLETVVIDHDALERIDPTAFDECPLVEIVLPDTPNYRKKVDEGVFPDKYKYRFAGSEAPKEIKKDSDISGETADQTKNEQKDSEKKTAGKKPATKKTTVKPDKPEAKAPVSPKKDSNKPDVKTKPDDIGKITTKASEPAKKKPANKAKTTEMAPAGAVNAADKTTAVPETEVKTTLETPPPDETSSPANLIIPEGVKEIAGWAYRRKPIENVVLPKSLKKIGVCAFEECKKLKSIEFPDGLESIDHYAFHGCTQLKEVHLPDSIKEINVRAFAERNASGPIIHLSSDLIRRIAKGRETEYSVLNGRSFVIDGEQFRTIKEYLTYTEKNRQVEEEMAREEKKKAASAASFSAARINTAGQAGNTYGSGSWGTQKKKRYTADMMPPGTDNPEQVAEELNEMEPERAKQMLELLAVVNRVSNTLNHLSDTVNNMAGNKPAQESDQRERIWRRIYELEEKRDNLKGLFVEFRKRKLQNEIDRLKEELKQL